MNTIVKESFTCEKCFTCECYQYLLFQPALMIIPNQLVHTFVLFPMQLKVQIKKSEFFLKQTICLTNWRPSTSHIDVLAMCTSEGAAGSLMLSAACYRGFEPFTDCSLAMLTASPPPVDPVQPAAAATCAYTQCLPQDQGWPIYSVLSPSSAGEGCEGGVSLTGGLSGGAPVCMVCCTNTLVCTSSAHLSSGAPLPQASNRLPSTRSAETYPVSPGQNQLGSLGIVEDREKQVLRWE